MRRHIALSGRNGRRGGALVLSLTAVVVIAIFAAALLQLASSTTRRQSRAVDQKQAFYLAEAGLAEAFTGLGIGKSGAVGSQTTPVAFGGGLFWVESTDAGGNRVELESTAMWGRGRVTLGLVAQGTEESVASLGIFSSDSLNFDDDENVLIDSFDSTLGSYADQVGEASNYNAIFGTNGNVELEDFEIRGDLVPGPTGSVDLEDTTVTGSTTPRAQTAAMPAIEVPDVGPPTSLDHDDPAPLVLPAGQYGYSLFDLGAGTTTLVQGPSTMVVDDFRLRDNATLELDATNGQIEVFVTGSIDLDDDAFVVTTVQDPAGVVFQVSATGDNVAELEAQSDFYGFVYAPDAEIEIDSSFNVYGGLVAKSLDLSSGCSIHYDIAIERKLRTLPTRISWRVVEIPEGIALKGMDPFDVLGVDPATLPAPADAHADQPILITYYDLTGALQTYNGPESAFDWSQVKSVVELYRDGQVVTAPAEWEVTPGGGSTTGGTEPPANPDDVPLLDAIADTSLSSQEVMNVLLGASPLSGAVMTAAINRVPPMDSYDLYLIFEKNGPYSPGYPDAIGTGPISSDVLLAAINVPVLSSKHLQWALVQNSPLEPHVLQAALDRNPPMSQNDINKVLAAQ